MTNYLEVTNPQYSFLKFSVAELLLPASKLLLPRGLLQEWA